MEKSNYKECLVDFKGKLIKATTWWNLDMKGSVDLFINDTKSIQTFFRYLCIKGFRASIY